MISIRSTRSLPTPPLTLRLAVLGICLALSGVGAWAASALPTYDFEVRPETTPPLPLEPARILVRVQDDSVDTATTPETQYRCRTLLLRTGEVWQDCIVSGPPGQTTFVRWAPRQGTAWRALLTSLRDLNVGQLKGACLPEATIPEFFPWVTYSWFGTGRNTTFQIVSDKPSGEPPCVDDRIPPAAFAIDSYLNHRLGSPQARTWTLD